MSSPIDGTNGRHLGHLHRCGSQAYNLTPVTLCMLQTAVRALDEMGPPGVQAMPLFRGQKFGSRRAFHAARCPCESQSWRDFFSPPCKPRHRRPPVAHADLGHIGPELDPRINTARDPEHRQNTDKFCLVPPGLSLSSWLSPCLRT